MLQCITCAKQTSEDGDEQVQRRGTPTTKEASKNLTAQIKDIVLKFKGVCTKGSSSYKKGLRSSAANSEVNSEGVQYPYMGGVSLGSTPPWDLPVNFTSGRSDQRFIGGTSGNQTPTVQDPVVAEPEAVVEEVHENKEWVAQVEPGVDVTFLSLPDGGNDLKRIRFNREIFDKWQARVWWGENFDRLRELYNVRSFNRQAINSALPSEDEQRESSYSMHQTGSGSNVAAWVNNDSMLGNQYYNPSGFNMGQGSSSHQHMHAAGSSMQASRSSSKNEFSFSNASDIESEWIEQVEPGVFVTVRQLPDGNNELKRIKFSRQRFGDEEARKWWEDNRDRLREQYL